MPIGQLYVFGKMSIRVFAHFLIGLLAGLLLLDCISCLYISKLSPTAHWIVLASAHQYLPALIRGRQMGKLTCQRLSPLTLKLGGVVGFPEMESNSLGFRLVVTFSDQQNTERDIQGCSCPRLGRWAASTSSLLEASHHHG